MAKYNWQKCGLRSACFQLSGDLSKPFSRLPLRAALDLGRIVSSAPSSGVLLASMGLFSSARFLPRIRQYLEVDSSTKTAAQGPHLQVQAYSICLSAVCFFSLLRHRKTMFFNSGNYRRTSCEAIAAQQMSLDFLRKRVKMRQLL